ncbi:glycosyl transferase family 2 [Sphingobacteriales bacterium UPWRP_1]|nr:hypothetical protein BVG80_06345 [Sphingobacteriales bacterium TSM_CSM]PSJ78028.1 glycosyl transferase family 2 [Sphingobacteriales bacterium UPWRP_1]
MWCINLSFQLANSPVLLLLLQIIFWLSVLAVAHTYLFYPLWLPWKAKGKTGNRQIYLPNHPLPRVYILMAVYNEEKVLAQKLDSIFDTTYPLTQVELWIGSDSSTDATHQIINRYAERYPNIKLTIFEGRNGKPRIINRLMEANGTGLPPQSVLVLTDANVLFTPSLLYQLVKHFKTPQTGVVGANVLNIGVKDTGISYQEMWYIKRENVLKHYESLIGGCMMGAFGACYAMRATLFEPVPSNFVVDDFYLTMLALEKGHTAIKELEAVCYEDVSDDIQEEYRRKKRISSGNFQNLRRFWRLLAPEKGFIAFAFLSHKVLRWFTPLLLIAAFCIAGYLAFRTKFYALLFVLQCVGPVLWFADFIFGKFNVNIKLFRFARYFYLMNLGLFIGLIKYIKGIESNVWKPTKRNA